MVGIETVLLEFVTNFSWMVWSDVEGLSFFKNWMYRTSSVSKIFLRPLFGLNSPFKTAFYQLTTCSMLLLHNEDQFLTCQKHEFLHL